MDYQKFRQPVRQMMMRIELTTSDRKYVVTERNYDYNLPEI